MSLQDEMHHFLFVKLYDPHCEGGVFPLTFHSLQHLHEALMRFRSLNVFDAANFELFNVHIKKPHTYTSKRRATRMDETVYLMPVIMDFMVTGITCTVDIECFPSPENPDSRRGYKRGLNTETGIHLV